MPSSYSWFRGFLLRQAFTLVELLVVIIVICIMASLVLPGVGGTDEARLLNAGRLLMADLDQARVCSLCTASDRCVVVFDAPGSRYYLAKASAPATPMLDPRTGAPYVRAYGEGAPMPLARVSIDAGQLGVDSSLGFTGDGRIDQSSDATLCLGYAGKTILVIVSAATGESRLGP